MSEATVSSSELSPLSEGETVEQAESETTEKAETELTLNVIFEALKNERRRLVLEYLEKDTDVLELGTVAEWIAAEENDKPQSEISYAERKRVYVALYQCHLPKLDEMGIISFNKSRGTIRKGDSIESVRSYLKQSTDSRPWHNYYAAIVGIGAILYGGSWLIGLWNPFTSQLILLTVFAAVSTCTVFHVLSSR